VVIAFLPGALAPSFAATPRAPRRALAGVMLPEVFAPDILLGAGSANSKPLVPTNVDLDVGVGVGVGVGVVVGVDVWAGTRAC